MFGWLKNWVSKRFATLRDTNNWLHDWVSAGQPTWTGERMSPETALTISEYMAAIRAISEDIGKIDVQVYRKLAPRGKRVLPTHPVQEVLDFPSPEYSSIAWRETMVHHAIGWGRGISEIQRDNSGRAIALHIIDPRRVRITRDDAGDLLYLVSEYTGDERRLRDENVFHLHGLGFDGVTGYSVATLARQSLGLSQAQVRAGSTFFRNGGRPGGVIEYPGRLEADDLKLFLDRWNRYHAGAENRDKVGVLEDGMTWKDVAIPQKDAQWIEARNFSVEELARWLRIPPHKIGHLLRSTFSNIESQALEYVGDTLLPWEVRIEQECRRKLIDRVREPAVYVEFVNSTLLRGDLQSRYAAYAVGRQWGWLSANDVRERESENGIGPAGDIYLTPMNMTTPEMLLEPPEPEPAPEIPPETPETGDGDDEPVPTEGTDQTQAAVRLLVAEEEARIARESEPSRIIAELAQIHRGILAAAIERSVTVERDRIARASKNGAADDLNGWAKRWYAAGQAGKYENCVTPAVHQFVQSCWTVVGTGGPLPEFVRLGVDQHIQDMGARHVADSLADIRDLGANVCDAWVTRAYEEADFEMLELRDLLQELVNNEIFDCTESEGQDRGRSGHGPGAADRGRPDRRDRYRHRAFDSAGALEGPTCLRAGPTTGGDGQPAETGGKVAAEVVETG